ncbi:MAG TPA: AAA family ATPase [Desulfobacteria bacterium]|nr:AAA family ATPase [Desulfobacteria bacterium]
MAAREIQVLAFVGAPAAGKTIAATVAKDMDLPIITMGDVIRGELKRQGLPLSDETAGRIATELREREGLDAIAKRCIPRIRAVLGSVGGEAKKTVVVIDGIRGTAEVERFKKEFGPDFTLVRVDTPLIRRYERIKARGRADDALTLEEFKEREEREKGWGMGEAMEKADKVVKNEGSLDSFKKEIRRILDPQV